MATNAYIEELQLSSHSLSPEYSQFLLRILLDLNPSTHPIFNTSTDKRIVVDINTKTLC